MIKHGKLGLEFFIRRKNIIERILISISNFDIVYSIFNNCNCNKKLALRKTSHNMRGGRELNDWKAASTDATLLVLESWISFSLEFPRV